MNIKRIDELCEQYKKIDTGKDKIEEIDYPLVNETIEVLGDVITYFEKSNVEKVFDMLRVKPNQEIWIEERGQIIRSLIYKITDDLSIYYKDTDIDNDDKCWHVSNIKFDDLLLEKVKIVFIPPKPLLTEEEKQIFKCFPKLKSVMKRKIEGLEKANMELLITSDIKPIMIDCFESYYFETTIGLEELGLEYKNLELDKSYTREELGL